MEVNIEYLESLLEANDNMKKIIDNIVKVTDDELVYNTKVHQRITASIPLYIPLMQAKFKDNNLDYLNEDFIFELRKKITKIYRMKGFYVYLTNHQSETDVCLTVTNEILT